jgi:hypothetical protein
VSGSFIGRVLRDQYRCPESFLKFELKSELSGRAEYFKFGVDATCYGRSSRSSTYSPAKVSLPDAMSDVEVQGNQVALPFDPTEIIDNLRQEAYAHNDSGFTALARKAYYFARPLTNAFVRRQVQRFHARNWQEIQFPRWPVETTVENICERLLLLSLQASGAKEIPFVWFWPRGHRGCVMMTHDVETPDGRDFCSTLMGIDESFGIPASFQIVPEGRYQVTAEFLDSIRSRGFEVDVQDLNHDGRLFDRRQEFLRRAALINRYGTEFGARGFRAAVLYRKPEWFADLKFSYDMSIPNVAHLDPQRGGCCTVFPYFIGKMLELPVTTVQDYMLFHLLKQRSTDLWKEQSELILQKNGLMSFIVHPDYMIDQDAREVYVGLLKFLRELSQKTPLWFALPRDVDSWWRARSAMEIVKDGDSWKIEGECADRAALAFARVVDGKVVYELADQRTTETAPGAKARAASATRNYSTHGPKFS